MADCDGSSQCRATVHVHGCFAERLMGCGHPESAVISDREGTAYCGMCEAEAGAAATPLASSTAAIYPPGCNLHGCAYTPGCPGCDELADELALLRQVRERLENDSGERVSLDALLAEFGYTRADFAPESQRGEAVRQALQRYTKTYGKVPERPLVDVALAELDSLLSALAQAEKERDEARVNAIVQAAETAQQMWREQKTRAERAEAECVRLREHLQQLTELARLQHLEWMHFHEVAIADPFKAEAEAQRFAQQIVAAAAALVGERDETRQTTDLGGAASGARVEAGERSGDSE